MQIICAFVVIVFQAIVQSQASVPGCEPNAELQRVLDEKLSDGSLEKMGLGERFSLRLQVFEQLIREYPREIEPHRRLIEMLSQEDAGRFPRLVEDYRRQAERHADDPIALYLASVALYNRDTPSSIGFLERAHLLAPDFPWPLLELARIYGPGTKRADKDKAAKYITEFFAACPSSTDALGQRLLARAGSKELQTRVANAIRLRLTRETDPTRVLDYKLLWALEFRTRATEEHNALRNQIAADLGRLQKLNAKLDAQWLLFLRDGYKQSDAPAEVVTDIENRLIEAFPHSEEAYEVVRARWEAMHKEPDDQADSAAWSNYRPAYAEALKGWIQRFTEASELQHEEWFDFVRFDPDLPPQEGLRALDNFLGQYAGYPANIDDRIRAADFLIYHKWRPQQVSELLRDSDELVDQWYSRTVGDNSSAELEEVWKMNAIIKRQSAAGYVLKAARLAEQLNAGERLKAFVERDMEPTKGWSFVERQYWANRARLAWLEGHKPDALTYYRKALEARKPSSSYAIEGRVFDDVKDEAQLLWKTLDGTDKGWRAWIGPEKIEQVAKSGWDIPSKALPAFELSDLSGKTWRLKDLIGRAVLVNVWATWCGPCQEELPKLQKLYDRVRTRSDLQILTMTIDEDLGVVAPFMKEKGYTFPVLPAYRFITDLFDLVGVPQNWILDSKGVWKWTGAPNVPDAEWENAMLQQLESALVAR